MSSFRAIVRRWSVMSRFDPARLFRSPRRPRLGLELLESRVVPSTIMVTTLLDSGQGSLRAAIEKANAGGKHSGGPTHADTIKFARSVRGTIVLTTPLPVLLTHVVISGPGPSLLTVARSNAAATPQFRLFTVGTGARTAMSGLTITGGLSAGGAGINNAGTLSLKDMSITGNSSVGILYTQGGTFGGGIDNTGTLWITNSKFVNNSATGNGGASVGDSAFGGAIANTGRLSITGSTFVSNTATGGEGSLVGGRAAGGAIENKGPGRLSITGHCAFISNSALGGSGTGGTAWGGAIDNSSNLSITGARFSLNTATGGSQGSPNFGEAGGGAIESGSTFSITSSTLNGNSATGDSADGGAIEIRGGKLSVTKSTFSLNAATSVIDSYGGAIYIGATLAGTLAISGSTFSGNHAASDSYGYGGAIFDQGTLLATNSTFNGNSAAGGQGQLRRRHCCRGRDRAHLRHCRRIIRPPPAVASRLFLGLQPRAARSIASSRIREAETSPLSRVASPRWVTIFFPTIRA